MRISLLEKREDFYKIIQKSLNNYINETKNSESVESYFVVNKYLNFIAHPALSTKLFKILVNEYSNSISKWRKTAQFFYVNLAVKKWVRLIFAQKIIKLSSHFSNYLILGGNHRIRLFSESIEGSLVILKSNERSQYILNDIYVRESYNLSFAPKILEKGNTWFIEEYFEGTPINRLGYDNESDKYIDILVDLHLLELIEESKEIISLEDYKELVYSDIEKILKVNDETDINKLIVKVFTSLYNSIKKESIEVSWTHGDFQDANILINGGGLRVIDWESADKRFYLYDYFTLFSKLRTNIPFKTAVNLFNSKMPSNTEVINLLLIEELRFSINEEFSLNFFNSGIKTKELCNDILNFINE